MDCIDRQTLVRRHNPVLRTFDPVSPLSVGNGEFAFTADATGLQSFPELYDPSVISGARSHLKGPGQTSHDSVPLCTQSQWGWHTFPLPEGQSPSDYQMEIYDAHGRPVGYPTRAQGQEELHNWLRQNPHRLHLGRVGLRLRGRDGGVLEAGGVDEIKQTLDLWTGLLESRFRAGGEGVVVETCSHPRIDMLAVRIDSALIERGQLEIVLAFPYGSPHKDMITADWARPERHATHLFRRAAETASLQRRLDEDQYFVRLAWSGKANFQQEEAHDFLLRPAKSGRCFEFQVAFSSSEAVESLPAPQQTFTASAEHWTRFWSTGGAVEVAGSRDERAPELERRLVLSQYLAAIQCSGSLPPQETGLTCNSWHGKFHLEMAWWHGVHFALWGRTHLFERWMPWYQKILPKARKRAQSQGYAGARWPKMVGPEGRDSPSSIAPLLIWQQPHPIVFAELFYREHPHRHTLENYREIVFATAEFMASYAVLNPRTRYYDLGPPVIPMQENHPPRETWNPTYELEYWVYGLELAQQWRHRLGMERDSSWEEVRTKLAPLPVKDGVYLAHENCPETYTERNWDHAVMLNAMGVIPGPRVDREIMRRTLRKVRHVWQWERNWGTDFFTAAMTAARVGEPRMAVDMLLMDTPMNTYLANGHNAGWQYSIYLPGNCGLLAAVALMAAGWRGGPESHAPGFPADGSWTVRQEGLRAWL